MIALLVVGATWWIAACLGRTLIDRWLNTGSNGPHALLQAEKFVFASAVGLGLFGYGAFALGLCGLLYVQSLAALLGVTALVGVPGMMSMWSELVKFTNRLRCFLVGTRPSTSSRAIVIACGALLSLLAVLAASACFQAPGAHAWDALAYHLADPKIFLLQHRIVPLPTEHHSNFPFTMEMLFTIGLAFDGYAAANLFHLVMAVNLSLAIVAFCRRYLTLETGLIAAVLLATTPLVLWEATIAYIDLGLALYVFLASYAVILAIPPDARLRGARDPFPSTYCLRIILLGGVFMGFALGIKYLALLPLIFLVVLALKRGVALRHAAIFVCAACVVGSPWYIKNVLWMKNPVYPFAFKLFPSSRYWSDDRAKPYAEEQRSFGLPHDVNHPIEAVRNLAITPWKMISNPELYTNRADFTFTSLIGGLFAGALLSLLILRGKPRVLTDLSMLLAAMFAAWFFVAQHIRYLIPALPYAAILTAYSVGAWIRVAMQRDGVGDHARKRLIIVNTVGFILYAGVIGQCVVLGGGVLLLPTSGRSAAAALEAGLAPTALSIPEVVADLTQAGERDRHIRRLPAYGAAEWINQNTPRGAGVVLYEDVHGFYLDRPYLWGNGEHSSYIPYNSKIRTGYELTAWLRENGIRYAVFNLNYSPSNPHAQIPDDLDSVRGIIRTWYDGTGSGWRQIVGEAIQSGEWVIRYTHHGIVVLEIGAPAT